MSKAALRMQVYGSKAAAEAGAQRLNDAEGYPKFSVNAATGEPTAFVVQYTARRNLSGQRAVYSRNPLADPDGPAPQAADIVGELDVLP